MDELNKVISARDISTFRKAFDGMVAKNGKSWNSDFYSYHERYKQYTEDEIKQILESGSIYAQQILSRAFFYKNGFYRRIIIYYATLLKYVGFLIPNPSSGTELSTPYVFKRYSNALNYLDSLNIPNFLTQMSLKAILDGCYYGVITNLSKTDFSILDLPANYCRSNFKDLHNNDIVEFNVSYFDNIVDESVKNQALKVYPKVISDHYRRWKKGQVKTSWKKIPTDIGLCFSFFDKCRPLFLDIIPSLVNYDEAVDINKDRDLEEIRKIIVQKIPHTADGTLVFEPPEALEMHNGAVDMMRGNKNISVLTTYADVDAVVSKAASEATTNTLEKNMQNIYSNTGVSGQLFAPTGSQALSTSITNDMALMMILADKYSHFLTYIINYLFANTNINFKYIILPVSWYNVSDYITDSMKLAQTGYSFLLPAIALGLSQKDLINTKHLENDALKLREILIPLESSYTQSSNPVGRPRLSVDEKAPKTLQNEESIDKQ